MTQTLVLQIAISRLLQYGIAYLGMHVALTGAATPINPETGYMKHSC